KFAVGGGKIYGIVADGGEVGGDLFILEAADRLHDVIAIGEGVGAAAIGAHSGNQVGGDGDEAVGGELVGHRAQPVGEAVDLADDDHHGRFFLDLGVHDKRLKRDF